jgi:hypothetical protein
VTLTDDSGTNVLATVADGVEVEILAWLPRRGGDTRYRVTPTGGGVEGWLGAASLQPRPPLSLKAGATQPCESGSQRPAAITEPVAMKTLNHSPKSTRRGTR